MNINFCKLDKNSEIPSRETNGSAGYDLRACLNENCKLAAGKFEVINTGIAIELPEGFFAMVCSRSGLAAKHGISMPSPGIIDSDYRGPIRCILFNYSTQDFIIENGMRIAQLIVCKHEILNWTEVTTLSRTTRGENGFGSTGLK
ncbi:MAG: dUTP diphosphatase [Holosporales bacterium]|jgi:dUTP pyrophosphatase|nr:dUTP diphosphatase [Holosporales bacterium]